MAKAFTAGVMSFIEKFRARWLWSIGTLESCLSVSPSSKVPASLDVSSPAVGDILRVEDDTDSQDSTICIDHGHLARNCSIKISEICCILLIIKEIVWFADLKCYISQ